MSSNKHKFEIDFLDHVAIHVKDLEASVSWYSSVLGLKKFHPPEWRPYPIFMLTKKFGVALFPLNSAKDGATDHQRVDHFAFNLSNLNFEQAIKWYEELGLKYSIQDHHYFKSLYTRDPDGYVVELTTLQVDETSFYNLVNNIQE